MGRPIDGAGRGRHLLGAAFACALALGTPAVAPATAQGTDQGTDQAADQDAAADWDTAPRALASNGAVIVMPEIDDLTCDQMAFVLHRIDLSHYRGPFPLLKGHPDWEIFDYEDRLTRRHYYTCMMNAYQLEDPSEAFSFGFGSR